MKKFWNIISDVAVIAGCAVGVGLISGKETQVFAGSWLNAVIFAVSFCIINAVFREFCRKNGCAATADVTRTCFKNKSWIFDLIISVCSFVCVVTCLAGAEQCLSDVLYVSNLPLYAVAAAVVSTVVMLKGMRALKAVNVASIIMTIALFAAVYATEGNAAPIQTAPKAYMPIVYALFSFVMSFGVICKLSGESDAKRNILSSVLSAAIIAALLIITAALGDFTKPLPTLGNISNPVLLGYAAFVIALSVISGIVSCAYPIVESLHSVIPDKTVCAICVFALALAFSMFGFDFAVKFGYVIVAIVGLTIFVMSFVKLKRKA